MIEKKALVIALGNGLEFYDFMLYGILAPIFAPLFFPHDNHFISLLMAYTLIAVGYIIRPLGVFLWGHIADKRGRKPVLIITISLMAISATIIAILPTYNSIGMIAPLILLVCRVTQGLAYAGEMPTSRAALYEIAPSGQKIRYTSYSEISTVTGAVTACLIVLLFTWIMPQSMFQNWGWRIPFAISVAIIIYLGYIRSIALETLPKINHKVTNFPVFSALKYQWKSVLRIMLIESPLSICFYTLTFYLPNVLQDLMGFSILGSLTLLSISLIILLLFLPLMIKIAKNLHVLYQVGTALMGMCLTSFLAFKFVQSQSICGIIISMISICFFLSMYLPKYALLVAKQSSNHLRASTIGLGLNIAIAIFGGTTPMVNTYLQSTLNIYYAPSLYLLIMSVIAIFIIRSVPQVNSENWENNYAYQFSQ
ncbi:MFS transporter [Fastidiosibacter lacustris]|uniref:MFS transporter n=1 Tax=Fastidiosibacter lacustris TaxID=2056695 RepID=UPI000E3511C2|nr:MFS transporter [Fastidiosibacter lacustris]